MHARRTEFLRPFVIGEEANPPLNFCAFASRPIIVTGASDNGKVEFSIVAAVNVIVRARMRRVSNSNSVDYKLENFGGSLESA